jgi:hypothetical protein
MPSLSRELRSVLERTIAGENGARSIAEAGAEQSLQRLAVDCHEPHSSLTSEERRLRKQLRARGRQLGDKSDPLRVTQSILHLRQAVAYEHWHRLLFARFLAENDLLMHPEHSVALTLDEVKELALGQSRDWIDLAAEYAQGMLLREVFRSDDPILRVPLSPEKRRDLEEKLNSLPRNIFLADDSLGWVYQFWQRDAKERIDHSGVKIGADELSPVTQLFTEDYMVLFLLENTLGAWWTARRGSSNLSGYSWTYLRMLEDGTAAAGSFDNWPQSVKDLRVLDPCMGSGHFLSFALPILARMREEEEGLPLIEAITAVLNDNLFGLELDPRCSQIAAFNLALTAWKLAGRHFELPALNLACSGLGINATEADWVKLAGSDSRAEGAMQKLYHLFSNASTLGSLIDPAKLSVNLFAADFATVQPLLEKALEAEQGSEEGHELAVAAQGLLAAARILSGTFSLVCTNVPYLGRGKQVDSLKQFCEKYHQDAKADLATSFVERTLSACSADGTVALVTPQNWLFLTTYTEMRKRLLTSREWNLVVKLGPAAFQDMNWWAANTALLIISSNRPISEHLIRGIDVSGPRDPFLKAELLGTDQIDTIGQASQLEHPDCRILLSPLESSPLLAQYADCYQGVSPADFPHFGRYFWEIDLSDEWRPWQGTVTETVDYGGRELVLWWNEDLAEAVKAGSAYIRGQSAWGKPGVVVRQMRHLPCTLYTGEMFDTNCAVITPKNPQHLDAIWSFCSSSHYLKAVRQLDQKTNVTNATLVKVPFDLDHWLSVAKEAYPGGLPKPFSSDPTQWIFGGHPKDSRNPLQTAVARMLNFVWPRQMGSQFPDCPALTTDGLEGHVAVNGIVCLSSVVGEENASVRLRALLQSAFGSDYNLAGLLAGKKSTTLEGWLRDEFFEEHCQIFQHRPFVWHIWDGLKEGFHALVNYRRLDQRNLEKLIFSHLGDWLTRQRQDVQSGVEGADARLAAAEHLQGELKRILEGEKPYDIFVRWKSIDKQPIGWEPDLNDGVRTNIRPWITEAKLYKASKPGILRVTPNIKYTKDRGQEPAHDPKEFPWFAKSADRINDQHLSLDEKRRARGLS